MSDAASKVPRRDGSHYALVTSAANLMLTVSALVDKFGIPRFVSKAAHLVVASDVSKKNR